MEDYESKEMITIGDTRKRFTIAQSAVGWKRLLADARPRAISSFDMRHKYVCAGNRE